MKFAEYLAAGRISGIWKIDIVRTKEVHKSQISGQIPDMIVAGYPAKPDIRSIPSHPLSIYPFAVFLLCRLAKLFF